MRTLIGDGLVVLSGKAINHCGVRCLPLTGPAIVASVGSDLDREPGPVPGRSSAEIVSLVFSDNCYIGPLQGGNDYSKLEGFWSQGVRNRLFRA